MQVLDKLIIFSPHISSKKPKNQQQQTQMFQDIESLSRYNP